MGEEVKSLVPESLLKRSKRNEEWALAKKQELEASKKKNVENRKLIFNRAKQYAKEYDAQVRVVIKGRVQGVFYRNWTIENATQLLSFTHKVHRRCLAPYPVGPFFHDSHVCMALCHHHVGNS